VNAAARAPVIVAGAGIGGLAAALALAQRGFRVTVLEQAAELGEIGAGVQLAPNAFAAFDALGVGERARGRAVYTDRLVMMDAVDETLVGEIPTGAEFQARFGNPYAVIHRADVHLSLLEGVRAQPGVEVITSTRVERFEEDGRGVVVFDGADRAPARRVTLATGVLDQERVLAILDLDLVDVARVFRRLGERDELAVGDVRPRRVLDTEKVPDG